MLLWPPKQAIRMDRPVSCSSLGRQGLPSSQVTRHSEVTRAGTGAEGTEEHSFSAGCSWLAQFAFFYTPELQARSDAAHTDWRSYTSKKMPHRLGYRPI